ncbi:Nn.00g090670.m01.CDS01 [Neocucurbitaria sp. VM-36]
MATDDITIPQHVPIGEAPRDVDAIAAQEKATQLPYWNAGVAFQLGCSLRTRLLTFDKPAVVHISTVSTPAHVLFHSVTHSGTALDNDFWVSRKRNAVIRFGASTWRLHNVFDGGNEEKFKSRMGLGEKAGEYAIHGGGVPVYAKNVDTPVAVVVVSGLKQWDDHQIVVEELANVCKSLERTG